MKRSNMIFQIMQVLFENDEDDITYENSAKDILAVIENAGMIPPCRAQYEGPEYEGHGVLDEYNSCEADCGSCLRTWEPENES